MKGYHQIRLEERSLIGLYLEEGLSLRHIGRLLGRPASTISREVKRNKNKDHYNPITADRRRLVRCHRLSCLDQDFDLKRFVIQRLEEGHSPQAISGRLNVYGKAEGLRSISHESIYRWLYKPAQKQEKLYKLLPFAHAKRGMNRKRGTRSLIQDRTPLTERPQAVELRQEVGHWEVDLLSCRRNTQFLLVMCERKTRYTLSLKLPNKSAPETLKALQTLCQALPRKLLKSLTFDNGLEFALHHHLREQFKIKTYFCDVYASWQKGSVENMNGRLRRDFPRKTNLETLSHQELEQIMINHNLTPRAVLNYKTPLEALCQELNNHIIVLFSKTVALRP